MQLVEAYYNEHTMITKKKDFDAQLEININDQVPEKSKKVIAFIETRIASALAMNTTPGDVWIRDSEWCTLHRNNRQLEVMKKYISQQYEVAGWKVRWLHDSGMGYDSTNTTHGIRLE